MFVFDTNVVSALRRNPVSPADRRMVAWAKATSPDVTYISSITLMEIEQGILLIERRDKRQAEVMRPGLALTCCQCSRIAVFENRTLPVDTAVALRAAACTCRTPSPNATASSPRRRSSTA